MRLVLGGHHSAAVRAGVGPPGLSLHLSYLLTAGLALTTLKPLLSRNTVWEEPGERGGEGGEEGEGGREGRRESEREHETDGEGEEPRSVEPNQQPSIITWQPWCAEEHPVTLTTPL